MADQPLLSALCSICNNNTPKYRCPGCSARTCSLPCYKRHQQRAQCDGKRDPTRYVKKNKLNTAAGIDHDYNFIAGIERGLDQADRLLEDSSISAVERTFKTPGRNSNFEKCIQEAGVIIDRAPAGMSREKNNHTHLSKRAKHLVWTVEWIHEDDRREIGELSEKVPLSEAHRVLVKHPHSKKRKLVHDAPTAGSEESRDPQGPHAASEEQKLKSASTEPTTSPPGDLGMSSGTKDLLDADSAAGPQETNPQAKTTHFYLVKPHTSSTRRVLIPLPNDAQLATCLRGRVVLEFPTIQILSTPAESLPPQFQLEADYLEQTRKEQVELDELLASVQPPGGMPITREDGTNASRTTASIADLDDQKILEVLRRDLGTRF